MLESCYHTAQEATMQPQLATADKGKAIYKLTENHPLRLVHAAGRHIDCLSGTAWITAYDQHTDFMLRAGQSFEIPNDGLTLIEAVGTGRVQVRLPEARPITWASRLALRWQRHTRGQV
jgi:hypothetical protein